MDTNLLEKYYRGLCTPEEFNEVLSWFAQSELTHEQESQMEDLWNDTNMIQSGQNQADIQLLNQIHKRIKTNWQPKQLTVDLTKQNEKKSIDSAYWLRVAAVLIFTTCIAAIFGYYLSKSDVIVENSQLVLKQNTKGIKTTIMLPDGTKVNLNSGSSILYPKIFGPDERRVFLEGEAFFDVAKNPAKPFKVEAGKLEIVALGTSFNINAFKEHNDIKVSLVSGSVSVTNRSHQDTFVTLLPGEQALWSEQDEKIRVQPFNLLAATGWKDGWIIFENNSLDEIVDILETWYGVDIKLEIVKPSFNKDWKYSGKYHNQSLENVLDGLGYVESFSFEISEGNVKLIFGN